MGCHIMLNLSHRLREREKERGYIKGPHYIGDDSGAWTCVLEDINSEMQKGFRFFFPPFQARQYENQRLIYLLCG